MPNSYFPVKIQSRGASNRRIVQGLKNGTIAHPMGSRFWYRILVNLGQPVFTPADASDQTIDLNATFRRKFPRDVERCSSTFVRVLEEPAAPGLASATVTVGDADEPDGLLTASSIMSAGVVPSTPDALENTSRPELEFDPTVTIELGGANISDLTAGKIAIFIPWRALVP